ncbi:MAG: 30S ribosomal protein S4e [Candidatus Bathyarchaeia archaeon]
MANKGGARHSKRKSAPGFWPIHRKEFVWISKPRAGPHARDKSIPLLTILRDILGLASKEREARVILADGKVKVNGRVRFDEKFPVGLMDVVEIEGVKRTYRLIPSTKRFLQLHQVDGEEKTFRLAKLSDCSIIKQGVIQLSLHDGSNLVIKSDGAPPTNVQYKPNDTLKLSIPGGQILDCFKFAEGAYALITGGKNVGISGNIVSIAKVSPTAKPTVKIRSPKGDEYSSTVDYVFIIGRDKPEISLPGG